jgi:hypothetical protein
MKRVRYVLPAVLVIALIAVAFAVTTYSSNSVAKQTLSSPSFAIGVASASINYPNPIGRNVTVTGVMTASVVAPACALASPPCAIADSSLYYVTVNGWNYRLIFSNSTQPPLNHATITVTGAYVTPSTYQSNLWNPQMQFHGDIYVTSYTYAPVSD